MSQPQCQEEAYGDQRRTQIVRPGTGESRATLLTASDLTPEKTIWVSVTREGLISRTAENKLPRLSGRAAPAWLLRANTRDTLYLVNELGEAAAIAVHVLPETQNLQDGVAITRISSLPARHPLAAIFNLPSKDQLADDWYVMTVSRGGMVKKSAIHEVPGPSAGTFTLVKVNEGDRLGWIRLTDGKAELIMATASGMAIRFAETEVRAMGLIAAGVMGIKLKVGDEVVSVDIVPPRGEVYLQRSDGHAKRVLLKHFPKQGRYGQGVIAWKVSPGQPLVGMLVGKGTTRATVHLLKLSAKAIRLDSAPLRTSPARGKSVIPIKAGDQVLAINSYWDPPRPIKVASKKKRRPRRKNK